MRGWRTVGRGLLVGYALLWALVLPFICWGAWATPGHPHRAPHFVFAKPQLTAAESGAHGHAEESATKHPLAHNTDAVDDRAQTHGDGTPAHAPFPAPQEGGRACHAPDSGEVAGVAHPESLLVTLLVVLLPGTRAWLRPRTAHFAQRVIPLCVADRPLAPPTPPPRTGVARFVAI